MRYFKPVVLCLVLVLVWVGSVSAQIPSQEKEKIDPPAKSLIRKDLLAGEVRKLDPPKRNIFTASPGGWQGIEEFDGLSEIQMTEEQNIEVLEEELPAVYTMALRYIGYVKSGKKITALILFEGEALAVDVGEEIAEGVSVTKISLEDITVVGLDQEPRTFPLEGEIP